MDIGNRSFEFCTNVQFRKHVKSYNYFAMLLKFSLAICSKDRSQQICSFVKNFVKLNSVQSRLPTHKAKITR